MVRKINRLLSPAQGRLVGRPADELPAGLVPGVVRSPEGGLRTDPRREDGLQVRPCQRGDGGHEGHGGWQQVRLSTSFGTGIDYLGIQPLCPLGILHKWIAIDMNKINNEMYVAYLIHILFISHTSQ